MQRSPDWLPPTTDGAGRGELLRRSFESRLERRRLEDDADWAAVRAVESLARASSAELDELRDLSALPGADALRAYVRLSPDTQAAAAAVLALSDDACALVARALDLPPDAAERLRALLGSR